MPQGQAGNEYILDLNGSAGAFVSVLAKSTVRGLLIKESAINAEGVASTPQGVIDYRIPDDNSVLGFTTIFRATGPEGSLPIALGSAIAQRMYQGEIIGQLGQPIVGNNPPGLTAATTMIQLRSGTAAVTSVLVTEYN